MNYFMPFSSQIGTKLLYCFLSITLLSIVAFIVMIRPLNHTQRSQEDLMMNTIPFLEEAQKLSINVTSYIISIERMIGAPETLNIHKQHDLITRHENTIKLNLESLSKTTNDAEALDNIQTLLDQTFDNTREMETLLLDKLVNIKQSQQINQEHMAVLLDSLSEQLRKYEQKTDQYSKEERQYVHKIRSELFEIQSVLGLVPAARKDEKYTHGLRRKYIAHTQKITDFITKIEDKNLRKSLSEKADYLLLHTTEQSGIFYDTLQIYKISSEIYDITEDYKLKQQALNHNLIKLLKGAISTTSKKMSILDAETKQSVRMFYYIAFLSLGASFLIVFLYIGPHIIKRIKNLAEETRYIAEGDFSRKLDITGNDEISTMYEALDSFRDGLIEKKSFEEALRVSEERYQLAVTGSASGLWDWNIEEGELFWSDRTKEIVGTEDKTFKASFEGFRNRIHADDEKRVMNALSDHLDYQKSFNVECRLKHENEEYVWVHIKGQAIWDENGKAMRIAGSVDDISTRKLAEEQLQAEKSFSAFVVQQAPYMIIGVQKNGKISSVNPATSKVSGYKEDELMGTDWKNLFVAEHKDAVQEVLFIQKSKNFTANILCKNKKIRIIEWNVMDTGHEGEPNAEKIGFVLSGKDITTERESDTHKRQTQKMQALGQLAGGIAHELNNLLQPITTSSEIIRRKYKLDENKGMRKYLDMMQDSVEKAKDIIDDVLAFSRVDQASTTILNAQKTAYESIRFALGLQKMTPNISLIGFDIENYSQAYLNKNDMIRVVTNLIYNAQHAAGPDGEIRISYQEKILSKFEAKKLNLENKKYAVISFWDNGVGIPEDKIETIFDPFYTTKGNEGTGLGLPIVYGIIESWKGVISVESKENIGTTFWIYIPLL